MLQQSYHKCGVNFLDFLPPQSILLFLKPFVGELEQPGRLEQTCTAIYVDLKGGSVQTQISTFLISIFQGFLPVIGVCGRSLVILSCKMVFDPHISSFNENIWIPFVNHLPATGNPKGPLTRYFPTSEQELKDMIWIRWGKVSFPGTWVSFCAMIPRYDMSHSGKMYLYLGIIVHFSCTPSHVFSDSQEPATSSMTSTCTNTLVNQLFRSFLLKYFLLKFY